jgi:hypothetical protein
MGRPDNLTRIPAAEGIAKMLLTGDDVVTGVVAADG